MMKTNVKSSVLIILLIPIILFACNSSDKKLSGGWVVDKAYYNNKPITWNLFTNSFELYKDHSCFLPAGEVNQRNTDFEKGIWSTYEKNGYLFLKIKTINTIFNRTFKVSNYRTVRDSVSFGMLTRANLSSDSLKLICTKAPY